MDFEGFPKIARLSRAIVISEKLDGTNAQICFDDDLNMFVGSRNRWITPTDDNYGFAKWCLINAEELKKLGPGRHFGEWWGQGIQRGYGIKEKRFSLFNTHRWADPDVRPACCHVVPLLACADMSTLLINDVLNDLQRSGSIAAPGFMNPEGIVVYHSASGMFFKKTIKNDESPKSVVK